MKQDMPRQIENVCEVVKKHVHSKNYRFTEHALQRSFERSISFNDALYVLKYGILNEKKTTFDPKRKIWKYAILVEFVGMKS